MRRRRAERLRARRVAAALATVAALAFAAAACEPADGPRRVRTRPLPTGAVDAPREGALVEKLVVEGWAVAEDGIDEVNVYVDGAYAGTALFGLRRPDVAEVYPRAPNAATSGFRLTLEAVPPGPHQLVVQARSRGGATHDLASRRIVLAAR